MATLAAKRYLVASLNILMVYRQNCPGEEAMDIDDVVDTLLSMAEAEAFLARVTAAEQTLKATSMANLV